MECRSACEVGKSGLARPRILAHDQAPLHWLPLAFESGFIAQASTTPWLGSVQARCSSLLPRTWLRHHSTTCIRRMWWIPLSWRSRRNSPE